MSEDEPCGIVGNMQIPDLSNTLEGVVHGDTCRNVVFHSLHPEVKGTGTGSGGSCRLKIGHGVSSLWIVPPGAMTAPASES